VIGSMCKLFLKMEFPNTIVHGTLSTMWKIAVCVRPCRTKGMEVEPLDQTVFFFSHTAGSARRSREILSPLGIPPYSLTCGLAWGRGMPVLEGLSIPHPLIRPHQEHTSPRGDLSTPVISRCQDDT
jgi:hypothetical protein